MDRDRGNVLNFSNGNVFNASTLRRRPKTQSRATSLRPSLPLIELCDGPTRSQVLLRTIDQLQRFDIEQLQVTELIIGAIARGQL